MISFRLYCSRLFMVCVFIPILTMNFPALYSFGTSSTETSSSLVRVNESVGRVVLETAGGGISSLCEVDVDWFEMFNVSISPTREKINNPAPKNTIIPTIIFSVVFMFVLLAWNSLCDFGLYSCACACKWHGS